MSDLNIYRVVLHFRPMGDGLPPSSLSVPNLTLPDAQRLIDDVSQGQRFWRSDKTSWSSQATVCLDGCFAAFMAREAK